MKELKTILGILGESGKCIIQNTNLNSHCTYTLEQIGKAKELINKLIIADVVSTCCDRCKQQTETGGTCEECEMELRENL